MKRIVSILLLFILFFQSEGTILLFLFRHQQIKNEIQLQISSGISDSDLVVLKIAKQLELNPNNSFQRTDEMEFRYLGKMYDVVKQAAADDSTLYYCIYDHDDTRVYTSLYKPQPVIDIDYEDNSAQKKQVEQLISFFYAFYISNANKVFFHNFPLGCHNAFCRVCIMDGYPQSFTSPPWLPV